METVPGMQDTAIILMVIISLGAGAVLAIICLISRNQVDQAFDINVDLKHYRADSHRTRWFAGTVVALVLCALLSWTLQRDEAELRAEREHDLQLALKRMGCPVKQAGDTDIIVLTYDTSADLHTSKPYRASNCSRIVDRGWPRQQPKPAIAARD